MNDKYLFCLKYVDLYYCSELKKLPKLSIKDILKYEEPYKMALLFGRQKPIYRRLAPCSYQTFERFTILTTESMTGTSTNTPTTVASAAPD